jgi:hypothetical protein
LGAHAIEPPLLEVDEALPVGTVWIREARGRRVGVVDREVEQPVDDGREVKRYECRNLVRRSPEAGPAEQVRNV